MIEIETTSGQELVIGPYILRVLDVQDDQVVLALISPDEDDGSGSNPGDSTPAFQEWTVSPAARPGRNDHRPPPRK
jgi:hypothetical protein